MKIFMLLLIAFTSCYIPSVTVVDPPMVDNPYRKLVSINQGAWGVIRYVEGNQMPGPSRGNFPGHPVEREVFFFEAVSLEQLQPYRFSGETFFTNVPSALIGRTLSHEDGFYEIFLKPGKYSLFVKEQGLLHQSGGTDKYFGFVEVFQDSLSQADMLIHYNASY